MQDRVPLYPGRVKMTPVAGQANTFDMVRADDPTQAGTPLNKATLLKDATAALYGLGTGAVPDDVLAEIGKYKQYWWRRRLPAGDWEYLQSSNRNAYPDSGTQDGYEYEYLGIPFDNAVTAPRIETGSYIGTGTYGSSNPNTLTFGFVPKLVLIYDGSKTYAMFFAFGIGGEYTLGGYLLAWEAEMKVTNDTSAKINGNVLNWYASNTSATTARALQLNTKSKTYHYFAIS